MKNLVSRQVSKNVFIVYVYVLSSFCILLNPVIDGLNYLDEAIVLFLALCATRRLSLVLCREARIIFLVLCGYLLYSLIIESNIFQAILLDFFLFLKPFICLYVVYSYDTQIPLSFKKKLCRLYKYIGVILWCILPFINDVYANTTSYYVGCISCAISYIFFSQRTKSDWIITILMLVPGLASLRSKFMAELCCIVYIFIFLKNRIRLNVKYAIVLAMLIAVSIYVNYTKFSAYFITGYDEGYARTIFYVKSFDLYKEYFPFGTGLGSFGTEAAAKYYSPFYHKLGMDGFYGLTPDDYGTCTDFLHDTFYPVLAEFGCLGLFFYFLFWKRLWNKANMLDFQAYKIFVSIFFIISIENIASNSFTDARSVEYMMLLGMLLKEAKNETVRT